MRTYQTLLGIVMLLCVVGRACSAELGLADGFESGLKPIWTLDEAGATQVTSGFAHTGESALKFAYVTDGQQPCASLQLEPLSSCTIRFWVYIESVGRNFLGWPDMDFAWSLRTEHDDPLLDHSWGACIVELDRSGAMEVLTEKPELPQVDIPHRPTDSTGDVVIWPLDAKFPVRRWFQVQMELPRDRRLRVTIDGRYAGTVPLHAFAEIHGLVFGGGLSLQAQDYVVYVDDIEVTPEATDSTAGRRMATDEMPTLMAAAPSAEALPLLVDLGVLKLSVAGAEVAESITDPEETRWLPFREGRDWFVVTLRGNVPTPCRVYIDSRELSAVYDGADHAEVEPSSGVQINDGFYVGVAERKEGVGWVGYFYEKPGPITIRFVVSLPKYVTRFAVRYPTAARGEAVVSRRGESAARELDASTE